MYDTYDSDVLERWNTVSRLEGEYAYLVKKALEEDFPGIKATVNLSKSLSDQQRRALTLDCSLDPSAFSSAEITLTFPDCNDFTPERISSLLEQAAKCLEKEEYHFAFYQVNQEQGSVWDISIEQIQGGKLLSLLEKAAEGSQKKDEPKFTVWDV